MHRQEENLVSDSGKNDYPHIYGANTASNEVHMNIQDNNNINQHNAHAKNYEKKLLKQHDNNGFIEPITYKSHDAKPSITNSDEMKNKSSPRKALGESLNRTKGYVYNGNKESKTCRLTDRDSPTIQKRSLDKDYEIYCIGGSCHNPSRVSSNTNKPILAQNKESKSVIKKSSISHQNVYSTLDISTRKKLIIWLFDIVKQFFKFMLLIFSVFSLISLCYRFKFLARNLFYFAHENNHCW